jgi:multiple antibiotic resistance protein
MEWSDVLKSTITLFAVVNPIGSIPIFMQLTEKLSPAEQRKAFRTGLAAAGIILFVFIFIGEKGLTGFFQIGLNDLTAAGGLLLLLIAMDHLVFGALVRGVLQGESTDAAHVGAVPIACPILAGPGSMMTVLLIGSEHGIEVAMVSILSVLLVSGLVLRYLNGIYRFLGKTICTVLSKILCLFIAAIGMHLLMKGVSSYFRG